MNKIINIEVIRKFVNEIDPIGLIDFETPESLDEYDPEVKAIIEEIKNIGNSSTGKNTISKIVDDVFHHFFESIKIKQELLDNISDKIYKILK